jgi:hypothetical protein
MSLAYFNPLPGEGKGVSQQFLTVGDEKSPNNNAGRNYQTADWVEITRKLRRCNCWQKERRRWD